MIIDNESAQKCAVVVVLTHNIILTIFHSYKIIRPNSNPVPLEWLSICSLCAMILFAVSMLLWCYPFYSMEWCNVIISAASISYSWSKLSLYIFFLERLVIVCNYNNTNLHAQKVEYIKIKSIHIIIIRFILIAWAMTAAILLIIQNKDFVEGKICTSMYPLFMYVLLPLGDFIISLTISILVCRQLLLLFVVTSRNDIDISKNNIQQGTEQIDVKYNLLNRLMLLSIVAIITTQISYLLSFFFANAAIWTLLDAAVNSWCVILASKKHKLLYQKICYLLHGSITYRCVSCYAWNCCCCKIVQDDDNGHDQAVQSRSLSSAQPPRKLKLDKSATTNGDSSNTIGHINSDVFQV